jgi:hypothetical protein
MSTIDFSATARRLGTPYLAVIYDDDACLFFVQLTIDGNIHEVGGHHDLATLLDDAAEYVRETTERWRADD